jgi:hypothetical protein
VGVPAGSSTPASLLHMLLSDPPLPEQHAVVHAGAACRTFIGSLASVALLTFDKCMAARIRLDCKARQWHSGRPPPPLPRRLDTGTHRQTVIVCNTCAPSPPPPWLAVPAEFLARLGLKVPGQRRLLHVHILARSYNRRHFPWFEMIEVGGQGVGVWACGWVAGWVGVWA